jgi:hypothetical protein
MEQTTTSISRQSVIVAITDQVVTAELAGEAVILNLKSGIYFGLDAIGVQIWEMIQKATTVDKLCQSLTAEYDVDDAQCERDLVNLLTEMATNGLIGVTNEAVA